MSYMSQPLKWTLPGGAGASPETTAWYVELRRRGEEIVAARRVSTRGPLPDIIPAPRRSSPAPAPAPAL